LESINDRNKALFIADVDSKVVAYAECNIQKSELAKARAFSVSSREIGCSHN